MTKFASQSFSGLMEQVKLDIEKAEGRPLTDDEWQAHLLRMLVQAQTQLVVEQATTTTEEKGSDE